MQPWDIVDQRRLFKPKPTPRSQDDSQIIKAFYVTQDRTMAAYVTNSYFLVVIDFQTREVFNHIWLGNNTKALYRTSFSGHVCITRDKKYVVVSHGRHAHGSIDCWPIMAASSAEKISTLDQPHVAKGLFCLPGNHHVAIPMANYIIIWDVLSSTSFSRIDITGFKGYLDMIRGSDTGSVFSTTTTCGRTFSWVERQCTGNPVYVRMDYNSRFNTIEDWSKSSIGEVSADGMVSFKPVAIPGNHLMIVVKHFRFGAYRTYKVRHFKANSKTLAEGFKMFIWGRASVSPDNLRGFTVVFTTERERFAVIVCLETLRIITIFHIPKTLVQVIADIIWEDNDTVRIIGANGTDVVVTKPLEVALLGTFQPDSLLFEGLGVQWMYDPRVWTRVAAFMTPNPDTEPSRNNLDLIEFTPENSSADDEDDTPPTKAPRLL